MNNKQLLSKLKISLNQRLKHNGCVDHLRNAISFIENTTQDLEGFRLVLYPTNARFISSYKHKMYVCINFYLHENPTMFIDTHGNGVFNYMLNYNTDYIKEIDNGIDYCLFMGV